MSDLSQAVARASAPFLRGVSQILNHEFTPEQRIAVCNELEAYVAATFVIVKCVHAEPSEVMETNAPVLIKAIGDVIGREITDDEEKKKLLRHVQAVTMVTLLIGVALQEKPTQKESTEEKE